MTLSLYNNRELQNEKGRLYFYDNAKFVLIFLVVLAHFLSPLTDLYPQCRVLWNVINTFHMPAFIFISGFFAKSYISADRTIKVQRTATYILLYLVSQIAVSAFEWFVLHKSFPFSLVNARSSLWFFQCLILSRRSRQEDRFEQVFRHFSWLFRIALQLFAESRYLRRFRLNRFFCSRSTYESRYLASNFHSKSVTVSPP